MPATVTISNNEGTFEYVATNGGDETISYLNGAQATELLSFTVTEPAPVIIYVDASAAAGGDGSEASPFNNISDAYTAAPDGATILIKSGTYGIGTKTSVTYGAMTISKNITFTGEGDVKFKALGLGFMNIQNTTVNLAFNNIQFIDSNITTANFLLNVQKNGDDRNININNCTFKNLVAKGIIGKTNTNIVNLIASDSAIINCTFAQPAFAVTTGTANNNFWGNNTAPTITNLAIDNWIIVNATITPEGDKEIGQTYTVNLQLKTTDGTTETALTETFQDITLPLSSLINTVPATVTISNNEGTFQYTATEGGDEVISYLNGAESTELLSFNIPNPIPTTITVEKINEGEKLNVTITADPAITAVNVTVGEITEELTLTEGQVNQVIETNLKPGLYTVYVKVDDEVLNSTEIEVNLREIEFTFDISNNEIGKQATVKVIPSSESFANNILVFVNGKEYTASKSDNYTITTDTLEAGDYTILAIFYGDDFTKAANNATSFKLVKEESEISINIPQEINIGDNVEIAISSYDGAVINVTLNGEPAELTDGKLILNNIKAGTYAIKAVVNETATHLGATASDSFNLFKDTPEISIDIPSEIKIGDNVEISITSYEGAVINVTVNGVETELTEGKLILNNIKAGTYAITATVKETEKYLAGANSDVFNLFKEDATISVSGTNATAGQASTITVTVNAGNEAITSGTAIVYVNESEYAIDLSKGKTVDVILTAGTYNVTAKFLGNDNYNEAESTEAATIEITESTPVKPEINIPTDIKAGENNTIAIDIPGATGNVSVIVDGNETVIPLVDGKANYTLSNMSEGDHSFVLIYPGDGNVGPLHSASSFSVAPSSNGTNNTTGAKAASAISSKNLSVSTYVKALDGKNNRYYTVSLTDASGKALANKTIQFAFNGKITNVTTDANGQAKLLIGTAKKGTYYVTASFLGDDDYNASFVTNTVKINPQKVKIVAKKQTFKRSKKVKKYKVTLKNAKGKAIKGKKIVITVNKKKYTAKTNKKGIATFKVKLTKKGTYKATIKFAGDNYYKKATKKAKIVIK